MKAVSPAGKVFPPPPVNIDITTSTDQPFSLKKVSLFVWRWRSHWRKFSLLLCVCSGWLTMLPRSGRRAARSCLGTESSRLVCLGVLYTMQTRDCSLLQITVWGEGVQEDQCEGETFLWQLVSPPHTHALEYTTHMYTPWRLWQGCPTPSIKTLGICVPATVAADGIKHLLTY